MESVSPEQAQFPPPTIPDDWHYPGAVGTGHGKVQRYLEITEDLLQALWVARAALGNHHGTFVTDVGEQVTRRFEDFCEEIGMAAPVALRWLRKYEDRLLSLPPGADASAVSGQDEDEERTPSADEIARSVLDGLRSRAGSASADGPGHASFAEVLTLEEAAQFLRCDTAFVREQVASGTIPAHRLADELRFVRRELVDWLTSLPGSPNGSPNHGAGSGGGRSGSGEATSGTGPHPPSRDTVEDGRPGANGGRRAARVGRGAKLTAAQRQALKDGILAELRQGTGITEAVQVSGIAWATFHNWRKSDRVFSEAITEIRGW